MCLQKMSTRLEERLQELRDAVANQDEPFSMSINLMFAEQQIWYEEMQNKEAKQQQKGSDNTEE